MQMKSHKTQERLFQNCNPGRGGGGEGGLPGEGGVSTSPQALQAGSKQGRGGVLVSDPLSSGLKCFLMEEALKKLVENFLDCLCLLPSFWTFPIPQRFLYHLSSAYLLDQPSPPGLVKWQDRVPS